MNYSIPILFLIFNRPDETFAVFNEIKKVKPAKLYIASDGPRSETELSAVNSARDVVNNIDWECQVETLFRTENLGCKMAVSSAINWFFEHEEMGVILEDDCLPGESFFTFCEKMLKKYYYDNDMMMISGTNFLYGDFSEFKNGYAFIKYYTIWGWATWRRAWSKYDIHMNSWPELQTRLKTIYRNKIQTVFMYTMLNAAYRGRIDTWDFQWVYTCLVENGYNILPIANLVSNIGQTGTHVGTDPFLFMQRESISKFENKIEKNSKLNNRIQKRMIHNIIQTLPFIYKVKLLVKAIYLTVTGKFL